MKTCFVISPIGREGTKTREHADDVFDFIIRPAMEDCGIQCRRSDHLNEPGKICEQMFREIATSDVCVALLTEQNPNVYYELALAQAWHRPVIILIAKDEEPPFDIRDLRCVSYDLKPRNISERVFSKLIVAHLKSLEQLDWIVPSPFGEFGEASDIAAGDCRSPQYFERYSQFGSSKEWVEAVGKARTRCDLMSLSLDSWKNRTGFADQLIERANAGCQVRLLQMHPDNPMLDDFGSGTKASNYLRSSIQLASDFYRDLYSSIPNIQFRQMLRGCLHSRLIVLDESAFISPYLYTGTSSPLWHCDSQSGLYQTISNEFVTLWTMNDPELNASLSSS